MYWRVWLCSSADLSSQKLQELVASVLSSQCLGPFTLYGGLCDPTNFLELGPVRQGLMRVVHFREIGDVA